MKKYKILNPLLAFRINEQQKDYTLTRGDIVELPETSPAVRAMLSRRQITEIPTPGTQTGTKKNK